MSCCEQAWVWLPTPRTMREAGGMLQNRSVPYFWLTTLSSLCITVAELRGAVHQIRTLDETQTAVKETKLQTASGRQSGPTFSYLRIFSKTEIAFSCSRCVNIFTPNDYETTLFILFIILNTELRVCKTFIFRVQAKILQNYELTTFKSTLIQGLEESQ